MFICSSSWICLALGILALFVYADQEEYRPLVFRICYGIGGPLELSGVLVSCGAEWRGMWVGSV